MRQNPICSSVTLRVFCFALFSCLPFKDNRESDTSTWKQFADQFDHLGMYFCIVCPFIKDKARQQNKRKDAGKELR